MGQYDSLDRAILWSIATRTGHTFAEICSDSVVRTLATKLSKESNSDYSRVVDRRLQALRKEGKITYTRASGWKLVRSDGETEETK